MEDGYLGAGSRAAALPALAGWPVALLAQTDPGIHELTLAHLVCVRPFHPFLSVFLRSFFSHI